MDKQSLFKPFSKIAGKGRNESRIEDLGHINVQNGEKKELKEKDAWDRLGYSCV